MAFSVNKARIFITIAVAAISVQSLAYAAPGGAPVQACSTMMPQHSETNPQEGDCPFEILPETVHTYMNEGLKVTLAVKSSVSESDPAINGFKGFMIMAFDAELDLEPIGFFINLSGGLAKAVDCPGVNNGTDKFRIYATHTNSDFKTNIDLMWSPPDDFTGHIIFRTTFVHNASTYWTRETSEPIVVVPDPTLTPQTSQTMSTEVPTTMTPSMAATEATRVTGSQTESTTTAGSIGSWTHYSLVGFLATLASSILGQQIVNLLQ